MKLFFLPATTDDGWTDWGDWGECSAACGDGEQERMRNCSIPHSSITGAQCLGPNKETRRCNNGPCKGKGFHQILLKIIKRTTLKF